MSPICRICKISQQDRPFKIFAMIGDNEYMCADCFNKQAKEEFPELTKLIRLHLPPFKENKVKTKLKYTNKPLGAKRKGFKKSDLEILK